MVMPVTKEEPFDLLPVLGGSMVLALGSFAVRIATHARQLAARLQVAQREVQRAERSMGAAHAAEGSIDAATETLRARTDVARSLRSEVARLRDDRDLHLLSASRAGVAVFACLVGVVAMLLGARSTYALVVASLMGALGRSLSSSARRAA